MTKQANSNEELVRENQSLRTRLEETTEVLTAIRTGGVDALVVEGPDGVQVFTLEGADHPYRTFVETMNEGAVTLALDGTIVYCNRQFADLVGTLLEQTFGGNFVNFVAQSHRPQFEALLKQGKDAGVRGELSLEQTYGPAIPVRLSAWPLSKQGGDFWCIIITDLRREKLHDTLRESEEHLRIFAGELEQRVEERTTELVGSQARLRALANELNRTEQRERKRIARELHDYPAQLLALAIIELSRIKLDRGVSPSSNDLVHKVHELVVEALNYTRTLVADLTPPMLHNLGMATALNWLVEQMKRHQLIVTIEMLLDEDLKLPEEQALLLFQSIRELLMNVSKHSGAGEATVSLSRRAGELLIEVWDTGKGFDVASKPEGVNGATFGLFSIRERMQALGGSFELESTVGKGTRATLVLPLGGGNAASFTANVLSSEMSESTISHPPSARSVQTSNSEHKTQSVGKQPIRVLLVDDHAMVRQGLRSLLDSYTDIEVVGEASNGEEALAAVVTHQPAIVVMDINMPIMNGIEATAAIRKRHPEIIVIGLSVQASEEMQQVMLKVGAAALLTKEAAVDQLYQKIQVVQKPIHT
jgi:PAS domain S-box-containing protein